MKVDYKNKALLSQETVESSQLEYAVEDTKLQLQSTLLATKRSLEGAKKVLREAKQDYPVNFQAIIDASLKVRDLEDGIKTLEALKKEWGF